MNITKKVYNGLKLTGFTNKELEEMKVHVIGSLIEEKE